MKYFFISLAVLLIACNAAKHNTIIANAPMALPQNTSLNGKLFTSLYQQRAAEYKALCLQAYNIAKLRIDGFAAQTNKPKAIITDIDETILDNSPYAIHQAYLGKEFDTQSWYQWTDKSAADTMDGAGTLLAYAASKSISIFYITNRDERERGATLKNLQKFNLPNADDAHFLPKTTVSSKEARRQQVMQQYEVVLLMGDNLADFSMLFDKKEEAERTVNTNFSAAEFGKKFIVFPNPNYGDWEGSLYKYNYKLTQAQKDSVIKKTVSSYEL